MARPLIILLLVTSVHLVIGEKFDFSGGRLTSLKYECSKRTGVWIEQKAQELSSNPPSGPLNGSVLTSQLSPGNNHCLVIDGYVQIYPKSKFRMLIRAPFFANKAEWLQVWLVSKNDDAFTWYEIKGPIKVGEEWKEISKPLPIPSAQYDGEYKVEIWASFIKQAVSIRYFEITGDDEVTTTAPISTTTAPISTTTAPISTTIVSTTRSTEASTEGITSLSTIITESTSDVTASEVTSLISTDEVITETSSDVNTNIASLSTVDENTSEICSTSFQTSVTSSDSSTETNSIDTETDTTIQFVTNPDVSTFRSTTISESTTETSEIPEVISSSTSHDITTSNILETTSEVDFKSTTSGFRSTEIFSTFSSVTSAASTWSTTTKPPPPSALVDVTVVVGLGVAVLVLTALLVLGACIWWVVTAPSKLTFSHLNANTLSFDEWSVIQHHEDIRHAEILSRNNWSFQP